jgi:hypothetical protein
MASGAREPGDSRTSCLDGQNTADRLDQLANRLTKILTETRKLNPNG